MSIPEPVATYTKMPDTATVWSHALLFSIGGLFAIPFLWPRHTMPIPSFYNEALAAMVLLCAASLAICSPSGAGPRLTPRQVPLVAFLCMPLVVVLCTQLVLGKLSFLSGALFPVMIMAVASAATILGSHCARRYGYEKLLTWIAVALIIGGCWNVIAQCVQLVKATRPLAPLFSYTTGSLYGNLAQRNHLATYLNWSLVAVLYLFAKGRLQPGRTAALLAIFLTGIVLTASRMSWIQTVWTAGAGFHLLSRMDAVQRPRAWRAVLALPLALLALTLVVPPVIDMFHLSFSRTAIERLQSEGLDHNRWLIYSQAWEIFKAHPLLGIGPGELQFNQLLLMDHYRTVLFASSAHNLLLDLLVMTGVAGTAGFAWCGLSWYLRVRKATATIETIAILLMLAALAIHSVLEFPEWYGFFLFPTMFLMGSLETRFVRLHAHAAARIVPLIAAVYGLGFSVVLWCQYRQLELLYYHHYQQNPDARPASVELMSELYAYHERSFFDAPVDFILSWNLQLDAHAVDEKLAFSEKAIRYQPTANVLYRHIVFLALAGRTQEALFYLPRLRASFPSDFAPIAHKFADMGIRQPALLGDIAASAERLLKEQRRETTQR